MSYDVSFSIDTGAGNTIYDESLSINFTYNYGPLWRHIGLDISEMKDKRIGDLTLTLKEAVVKLATMSDEECLELIAGNGTWGNASDFREKVQKLYRISRQHPNCIVGVC